MLRTIDDPNALRFGPGTIFICNGTQEKLAGHAPEFGPATTSSPPPQAAETTPEPAIEVPVARELFIDGPDSLGARSRCGYSVCAYDENGQKFYLDAEWSIVETDIADAAIDAETGLLYTGSSPGKIVLRATTVYGWGTYEKTVTVGPYEGLVIPVWAALLVLVVLLAAIVFAIVRIVIAVRRKKKRKS